MIIGNVSGESIGPSHLGVISMIRQSAPEQKKKKRNEKKGNFCPWIWKLKCGPGKQGQCLERVEDRRWETGLGISPYQAAPGTWEGRGQWLGNWSKLEKKRCLQEAGWQSQLGGGLGSSPASPCPPRWLAPSHHPPPAFASLCHLSEI